MQISKEMLIGELLQVDENMAQILMGAGMHCIGCPSSQMEEACMVHGIPVEKLVSVINEFWLRSSSNVCDRSREFGLLTVRKVGRTVVRENFPGFSPFFVLTYIEQLAGKALYVKNLGTLWKQTFRIKKHLYKSADHSLLQMLYLN